MNAVYTLMRLLEPPGNIDILMYHGFTDRPDDGISNYHGKHLRIDKFRAQMRYLKDKHTVLSFDDLLSGRVAPRSVVITMDDGYRSNFSLAFPVLQELSLPATVFVTTDFIDKKEFLWVDRVEYALNKTQKQTITLMLDKEQTFPLSSSADKIRTDQMIKETLKRKNRQDRDEVVCLIESLCEARLSFGGQVPEIYAPLAWDDIRAMQSSGLVAIGCHTVSHTILTSCPDKESMRAEVLPAKARVEKETSAACRTFSYPNGGPGDFNDQTERVLAEAGFDSVLTTLIGANKTWANKMRLKRLSIVNQGEMPGFLRTLYSTGRFLRKVKNVYPS